MVLMKKKSEETFVLRGREGWIPDYVLDPFGIFKNDARLSVSPTSGTGMIATVEAIPCKSTAG